MALRSIWNGTLAFGLVKVPVKLYSATEAKTIRFREVHLKDGARLEHRRVCEAEDETVPFNEVVKGYEVTPGEYVVLDKDEIRAAAGDRGKLLEMDEFVTAASIDPLFFERTYFLGPRDEGEPYELLRRALSKCGLAGIGRFSMRGREYLAAVRARDEGLVLHTLKFHDEIVAPADLDIPRPAEEPGSRELKMAAALISGLTEEFDPDAWKDRHRDAVMEVIEAKAKGRKPKRERKRREEPSDDLAAALEASLAGQGAGR
jgi:DNA end-binding protein Ku